MIFLFSDQNTTERILDYLKLQNIYILKYFCQYENRMFGEFLYSTFFANISTEDSGIDSVQR